MKRKRRREGTTKWTKSTKESRRFAQPRSGDELFLAVLGLPFLSRLSGPVESPEGTRSIPRPPGWREFAEYLGHRAH